MKAILKFVAMTAVFCGTALVLWLHRAPAALLLVGGILTGMLIHRLVFTGDE